MRSNGPQNFHAPTKVGTHEWMKYLYAYDCYPIPLLASPLKGKEKYYLPLRGRVKACIRPLGNAFEA